MLLGSRVAHVLLKLLDFKLLDERLDALVVRCVDKELTVGGVVLPVVISGVENVANRGTEVAILHTATVTVTRAIAAKPSAIERIQLLPRDCVPDKVVENLVNELSHVVVAEAEVVQSLLAILRNLDGVVVGDVLKNMLQDILTDILTSEVVTLDVLALTTGEALVERDEDDQLLV